MDAGEFFRTVMAAPEDFSIRLAWADLLDREGRHADAAFFRFRGPAHVRRGRGCWQLTVNGDGLEDGAVLDTQGYLGMAASLVCSFPPACGWSMDVQAEVRHGFLSWFGCEHDEWLRHVAQCQKLLVPNLALTQPLLCVTITDRVPEEVAVAGRAFRSWRWRLEEADDDGGDGNGPGLGRSSMLAEPLYSRLAEGLLVPYPTARAAAADLGSAALHLARGTRPKPPGPRAGSGRPRTITS